MDVADLIVRAGYDGSELSRGLRGSASEVTRFGAEFKALSGSARTFKLPEPARGTSDAINRAVAALKSIGAVVREVERDATGMRGFSVLEKDAGTAAKIFAELGANARIVTTEMAATAAEMAKADAELRNRIALLGEGARINATQGASLKELRTVYAQLSREVATSNPSLERRIQLEGQLVRIRKEFAAVTASSRPTVTSDFAAAAVPVQRTANALNQVRAQTDAATRSFTLINRQTGEFTALGRRASGAAVAVGFGLEALARGGAAADGGLRTALRSVASFAAFLGPQGLIVSGAAAATAAIIDLFKKSREEMERTQRDFAANVSEMIQSSERDALKAQLQDLVEGVLTLDPKKNTVELANGIKQIAADSMALADSLSDVDKRLRSLPRGALADILLSPGVKPSPVSDRLDEVSKKLQEMRREAAGLQAAINATAQPIQGRRTEGRTDADLAAEAIKRLKEQVDNTTRRAEQLTKDFVAQRDIGVQLLALHDAVSKKLGEQKDITSGMSVQLGDMLEQLLRFGQVQTGLLQRKFPVVPTIDAPQVQDAIDKVIRSAPKRLEIPIALKPNVEAFDLRNFEAAVQRLKEAEGLVDFSKLTGDAAFQRDAEQRLKRAQQAVQDYSRSVAAAMIVANVPLETQRAMLEDIQRLMKGLQGAAPTADLSDNIRAITTAGRGLLQTAEGLGRIGDNAREALDGVLQLADAIAQLTRKDDLGKSLVGFAERLSAAVGIVGGAVSLLNSIGVVGKSPASQARDRILEANNQELARLSLELRNFGDSIGDKLGIAEALDALDAFFAQFKSGIPRQAQALGGVQDEFVRQLKRTGLTKEELAAFAKGQGFDILDSRGNIIPEAIEQFTEGLRKAAAEAVRFGDSFEEMREATNLLNRARGITEDPARIIKDNVDLFKTFAPDLFKQFFANVDFGSPAQVRKSIDDFLTAWLTPGLIDPRLFKGLEPTEVREIIRTWLDAVDGMTNAVKDVTAAMLNIPTAFKIARIRFEAQDPFIPQKFTPPPPLPPVVIDGTSARTRGATVTTPTTSTTELHVHGPIYVDARDKPAHELFEAVKKEVKRQARILGPSATADDV